MRETLATARHHAIASLPPAKGDLLISRTGCAPSAARSCRKASTPARYWAVEGLHGVGIDAPNSSFSTTSGVVQPPVRSTARLYSSCAAVSMVEGSPGLVGVP